MTFSDSDGPAVSSVERVGDYLRFFLRDGRRLDMPLSWYPRLCDAGDGELANWRLLGGGEGVNWPDLDEDISVKDVVDGLPSGEGARSLGRWLRARRDNREVTLGAIHKYEQSLNPG